MQPGRSFGRKLNPRRNRAWLDGGTNDACSLAQPFPSQLMAVASISVSPSGWVLFAASLLPQSTSL